MGDLSGARLGTRPTSGMWQRAGSADGWLSPGEWDRFQLWQPASWGQTVCADVCAQRWSPVALLVLCGSGVGGLEGSACLGVDSCLVRVVAGCVDSLLRRRFVLSPRGGLR